MSPHEAYCQFLIAIEVGHIAEIYDDECFAACEICPAQEACHFIRDFTSTGEWSTLARDFFSSVDQDLPLSHYREHYPEYFL